MDPDFAAAFSSEYPEAYGAALRSKRGRNRTLSTDASIAVHVPVIPQFVSRLTAGVIVLFLLMVGFVAVSQSANGSTMGIPSGQLLNGPAGTGFSGSKVSSGISTLSSDDSSLGDKVAPIGEAGSSFLESWMN